MAHQSFEAQRYRETMQRSATHGDLAGLSLLDKLLVFHRGLQELQRRARHAESTQEEDGVVPADLLRLIQGHERTQPRDEFLRDDRVQHALRSAENELLISNADAASLPVDLGETLHLQTS